MRLPFACPLLGTWPATQACALTGNQTGDPLICIPVLNPLNHTNQGSFTLFLKTAPNHHSRQFRNSFPTGKASLSVSPPTTFWRSIYFSLCLISLSPNQPYQVLCCSHYNHKQVWLPASMKGRCECKGKWVIFRCWPPGRWGTLVSKPISWENGQITSPSPSAPLSGGKGFYKKGEGDRAKRSREGL